MQYTEIYIKHTPNLYKQITLLCNSIFILHVIFANTKKNTHEIGFKSVVSDNVLFI